MIKEKFLNAMRTLRDACFEQESCEGCDVFAICPNNQTGSCPEHWDLPLSDMEIAQALFLGKTDGKGTKEEFAEFMKGATEARIAEARRRMGAL